jgi:hypothetical protein
MSDGLYTTQRVMGLVKSLLRTKTFFLDKFYPSVQTEESEEVHIDIELGHRKAAPFVAPRAQAKSIRLLGFKTRTFTPPTIKLIADLNPKAALARMAGERIGGDNTAQNRAALVLAKAASDVKTLIERKQEQMAIESLTTGTVTVEGEGYEEPITIDFGRDEQLTAALTGDARWNQSGAKPLEDIETMGLLVQKIEGARITDVVMDIEAWKAARKDPQLIEILKLRRAVGNNTADLGPRNVDQTGATLVADVGDYKIWVYTDFKDIVSINEAGAVSVTRGVPVLAPGTVIGVGPVLEGIRLFGAIQDQEAIETGFSAVELFMNSWIEKNPGRRLIQGQSAPLPTPKRPNASYCLNVFGD